MANAKISALSAAAALGGTETIPGVQSGVTVKLTPAQIKTYVSASPSFTGTIGSDLPVGAAGTVKQISAGMQTTVARFRERVAVDMLGITTNLTEGGVKDNAALSSWQMLMGATSDVFGVSRSPAGSADLTTLFSVGSTGNTTVAGLLTVAANVSAATYLKSGSYTVATVPSASAAGAGARIYVSNESGGAVLAFSDATNWRRVTDRAVIS